MIATTRVVLCSIALLAMAACDGESSSKDDRDTGGADNGGSPTDTGGRSSGGQEAAAGRSAGGEAGAATGGASGAGTGPNGGATSEGGAAAHQGGAGGVVAEGGSGAGTALCGDYCGTLYDQDLDCADDNCAYCSYELSGSCAAEWGNFLQCAADGAVSYTCFNDGTGEYYYDVATPEESNDCAADYCAFECCYSRGTPGDHVPWCTCG